MNEQEKFKTFLAKCLESYENVRKLMERRDPEHEPYKSKYEAKEVLCSLKKDLVNYEDDMVSRCQVGVEEMLTRTKCITAAIHYKVGVISVETEEFSGGEEHLSKCLEIAEGSELSKDWILVVLQTLNQIGILWSLRGEIQKALEFLKKAENLSKKYRKEVCVAPLDIDDLFIWEVEDDQRGLALEDNWKIFEKTLTHTMYYLAQVYTNLDENVLAAEYCHTTLRRQLESRDFDPLDWAINSATLSQFFVGNDYFADARHHLACATYVLDSYESELRQQECKVDDYDKLLDTVQHRRADVAKCWAKYGLILLSVSWDDLMRQTVEDMTDGMNGVSISEDVPEVPAEVQAAQDQDGVVSFSKNVSSGKPRMVFKSLEVTTIEEQVPTKHVLDFEQARLVFLSTQKWLNQAKEFYTLTDHASDHVELVQDMSKLYKLLAYFENVEERQCKMHKRRIDMLESVLKELNPQFYLSTVRQLQFELAETYCQIMDLKFVIFQDPTCGGRSSHAIKKVNHLAEEGMRYFQAFIDTFMDSSGKLPEVYPEELVRPALLAHFYIGRFHSKIISDNTDVTIANLKKSYLKYKFLVDYCEKNPSAVEVFKEEIGVTKEMVQLLSVKMDKVTAAVV